MKLRNRNHSPRTVRPVQGNSPTPKVTHEVQQQPLRGVKHALDSHLKEMDKDYELA